MTPGTEIPCPQTRGGEIESDGFSGPAGASDVWGREAEVGG